MNWIETACVVAFVFSVLMWILFIGWVIYRKKRGAIVQQFVGNTNNTNASVNQEIRTPNKDDTKADNTSTIDMTTSNGKGVKHPDNNTAAGHVNQDELEDSSSNDSMYVAHDTAGQN
eukprot:939585_1